MNSPNLRAAANLYPMMEWLFDLGNDLDRCERDYAHVKHGGEIIYVFDSKLFRLFCQPTQYRSEVAAKFALEAYKTQSDDHVNISERIALLTSEYLFSEELVGARHGRRFITPWHAVEVKTYFEDLLVDRMKEIRQHKELASNEIRDKLNLVNKFAHGSLKPNTDLQLFIDGAGFAPQAKHLSEADEQRFLFARNATRTLTDCVHTEPLDQLYRMVTPPNTERIQRLDKKFRVPKRKRPEVENAARDWFEKFQKTSIRYENEDARSTKRSQNWADAQSLALVQWIANNALTPDQKIVFVTAHPAIFDAYRRWYLSRHPFELRSGEEFLLRRTRQYAPVFHIINGLLQAGEKDEPAEQSRERKQASAQTKLIASEINHLIDGILFPLKLAALNGSSAGSSLEKLVIRERMRKRNKRNPLEFFETEFAVPQKSLGNWLSETSDKLETLIERWRAIERVSLGGFSNLVVKRLRDDYNLFGNDVDINVLNRTSSTALADRIFELVDQLGQKSYEQARPMALRYLKDVNIEGLGAVMRIPKTLWARDPMGRFHFEVIENARRKNDHRGFELSSDSSLTEPHSLFSFCALLALSLQNWETADEFAEQAIQALSDASPEDIASERHELLFQNAVTLRFSIGSLDAHLESASAPKHETRPLANESYSEILTRYRRARGILNSQIHRFESGEPGERETLLAIRARAERAALHLFMSYTMICTPKWVRIQYPDSPETSEILQSIEEDHAACFERAPTINSAEHLKLLDRSEEQFTYNTAAYQLVRLLLGLEPSFDYDDLPPKYLRMLTDPTDQEYARFSIMTKVEVGVFNAIYRPKFESKYRELVAKAISAAEGELALDQAVCMKVRNILDL